MAAFVQTSQSAFKFYEQPLRDVAYGVEMSVDLDECGCGVSFYSEGLCSLEQTSVSALVLQVSLKTCL